jgi:hypothetical protein
VNNESARFYFGRVIKGGILNQEVLINSIKEPKGITYFNKDWTFIDVEEVDITESKYITGKLCKYDTKREVQKVDIKHRSEQKEVQENIIRGNSRFLYIPEFSGICYMEVPNEINSYQFENIFQKIILETNENFFVTCEVNPISDIREFWQKITNLEKICRIKGYVKPPNPLFGEYWRELKEYIRKREAQKISYEESSEWNKQLKTELKNIIGSMLNGLQGNEEGLPTAELGDAVVLMAADGYGHALVSGFNRNRKITYKTSETKVNREYSKGISNEDLYKCAYQVFRDINDERIMGH